MAHNRTAHEIEAWFAGRMAESAQRERDAWEEYLRTIRGTEHDVYQQAESLVLNDDTVVVPLNWYQGNFAWGSQLHNVVQSALLFVAYDDMWIGSK